MHVFLGHERPAKSLYLIQQCIVNNWPSTWSRGRTGVCGDATIPATTVCVSFPIKKIDYVIMCYVIDEIQLSSSAGVGCKWRCKHRCKTLFKSSRKKGRNFKGSLKSRLASAGTLAPEATAAPTLPFRFHVVTISTFKPPIWS